MLAQGRWNVVPDYSQHFEKLKKLQINVRNLLNHHYCLNKSLNNHYCNLKLVVFGYLITKYLVHIYMAAVKKNFKTPNRWSSLNLKNQAGNYIRVTFNLC